MKTLLLIALLGIGLPSVGQEPIFAPVESSQRPLVWQNEESLFRYQAVVVRLDVLSKLTIDSLAVLNLFDDKALVGRVKWVDRRSLARYSLSGEIVGHPEAHFAIAVEEDTIAGIVNDPIGKWIARIRFAAPGLHGIGLINPMAAAGLCEQQSGPVLSEPDSDAPKSSRTPKLGGRAFSRDWVEAYPKESHGAGIAGGCVQPTEAIDVFVAYTNEARQFAGGTNAIRSEIQLAVDQANQGLRSSLLDVRLRLAQRAEYQYIEGIRTMPEHLVQARASPDIASDRNVSGGDIVSFWVSRRAYGTCGTALLCDFQDPLDAYHALALECQIGGGTAFVHEAGHSFGCDHNREDDTPFCQAHGFSHGHRFEDPAGDRFITIMSYSTGDFSSATVVLNFSNPDVLFRGVPTGVPIGDEGEANNAETIRRTARTVEDHFASRYDVWVEFSYRDRERGIFSEPFNTLGEAVFHVIDPGRALQTPVVTLKPGETFERILLNKPMLIRACGGSALIKGDP